MKSRTGQYKELGTDRIERQDRTERLEETEQAEHNSFEQEDKAWIKK
jgi:hypothetical protein